MLCTLCGTGQTVLRKAWVSCNATAPVRPLSIAAELGIDNNALARASPYTSVLGLGVALVALWRNAQGGDVNKSLSDDVAHTKTSVAVLDSKVVTLGEALKAMGALLREDIKASEALLREEIKEVKASISKIETILYAMHGDKHR